MAGLPPVPSRLLLTGRTFDWSRCYDVISSRLIEGSRRYMLLGYVLRRIMWRGVPPRVCPPLFGGQCLRFDQMDCAHNLGEAGPECFRRVRRQCDVEVRPDQNIACTDPV